MGISQISVAGFLIPFTLNDHIHFPLFITISLRSSPIKSLLWI